MSDRRGSHLLAMWRGGLVCDLLVFVYLTGLCYNGRVSAHYLPLDHCDFYFQGHRESAPMLSVMATRNVTFSTPVLTKYDTPVRAARMSADCAFVPDPSMLFEMQPKCVGHFHVNNHQLSGRFAGEVFAPLETFRVHQVLLLFDRVELQDGTVLDENDKNNKYTHSRRCLTFLTTPEMVTHYRSEKDHQKEDVITRMTQMVPRMLNNVHRKKLKKISESAGQIGRDIGSFVQNVANFP